MKILNWRTILGLVLILAGLNEFYNVSAHPEAVKLSFPHVYIKTACIIWVIGGVILVARGVEEAKK